MDNSELQERLHKVFNNRRDAYDFAVKYIKHCHAVDDIIDNEDCRPSFVIKSFVDALFVFTHPYFLANLATLKPIAFSVANNFANSCEWEKSDVDWKKKHADILRHAGCDMLDVVVFLVAGYDTMREISPMYREFSHHNHLNDLINYGNDTDKGERVDDSVQK